MEEGDGFTDSMHALEAITEAMQGGGEVTKILVEKLLSMLEVSSPESAYICASVVTGLGDGHAIDVGNSTIKRLSVDKSLLLRRLATSSDTLDLQEKLHIDALVLTVKRVEFDAALAAFGVSMPALPITPARGVEVWTVEVGDFTVGISSIGIDGNVESALKIGRLFETVDFRSAFLVGMAAGVRSGGVSVGDVVISEEVWAADFEILRPEGVVPRRRTYSPPHFMWSSLATFGAYFPEWGQGVANEIVEVGRSLWFQNSDWSLPRGYLQNGPSRSPQPKTGVVFAGSRLIEDGSLIDRRETEHARLLAAEMEGAGFAAALGELDFNYWLVVRGVADYGQPKRVKHWQFAATFAAAALVRDCLHSGRFPIRPKD